MCSGWKSNSGSSVGGRCFQSFVSCVNISLPKAYDAVLVDPDCHGTKLAVTAEPGGGGRHVGGYEEIDNGRLQQNTNKSK